MGHPFALAKSPPLPQLPVCLTQVQRHPLIHPVNVLAASYLQRGDLHRVCPAYPNPHLSAANESSPEVGSSRKITAGVEMMPVAMDSRLRSPPLRPRSMMPPGRVPPT